MRMVPMVGLLLVVTCLQSTSQTARGWGSWMCVTGSDKCQMQYRVGKTSQQTSSDGNEGFRVEIRPNGVALPYALYAFRVSYIVMVGHEEQSKSNTSRHYLGGTGGPLTPDTWGHQIVDVALAP
jgi:hypothetical protein